ncbi:uncharacterized protein BX663DRAFT_507314 [Cokeromyces recurvatus]|uniref:uncharacterized protein n=1 Tax=Cokeromyces recurvatus TaxID=90255 RepID=UPI0022211B72|nr:uncharacterized protein BX663DRAFT_507314 [Cokeromyces recurvatus]KAI7903694.1 hypothetical protein BX663DRAFT_507314 [Cokeromyces recurvatus]
MLAIKHSISKKNCIQLALTQQRWISKTLSHREEKKKASDQFSGILTALGTQKDKLNNNEFSNVSSVKTSTSEKPATLGEFIVTLQQAGQSPHQIYINASNNNTIITLTRPNGAPLLTTSGGSAGFKKAARSGYEAAHQAALQLLDKINSKNLQVLNINIVLKGFGPGREAAFKALVSGALWNVKRITDATPIPFGGCRPKKARRL